MSAFGQATHAYFLERTMRAPLDFTVYN